MEGKGDKRPHCNFPNVRTSSSGKERGLPNFLFPGSWKRCVLQFVLQYFAERVNTRGSFWAKDDR